MSSLPEHADRAVQDQLGAAVRDFLAGIRKWGDQMQQFGVDVDRKLAEAAETREAE